MGTEGTEGADYPAAVQARLDAGFTEEEVRQTIELASKARDTEKATPPRSK